MSETNIKVSVELVDKATQKTLAGIVSGSDQADKGLNKLKKNSESAFSEISLHIGKATGIYDIFVGNLAANLATKAFDVLIAGASKLFQTFVVDGVKAAAAQEEATNALKVALAQSGIYSRSTAKEFEELADQIQATTGVEDDLILKNAALIQNLGSLDKDGLKRATMAAVNLAAALDKDLGTASEALGKAANGNITALQRMGITIEKGQTKAETFSNALAALEKRFDGAAAARVNTYAGAVRLNGAAFGELQETIGDVVVKNVAVIEAFKAFGKVITGVTTGVEGQSQKWREFVAEGIIYALKGLQGLAAGMDAVLKLFKGAVEVIAYPFKVLAASIEAARLAAEGKFSQAWDVLKNGAKEAALEVGDAFSNDTFITQIGDALGEIEGAAQVGFQAVKNGAIASVEPINQVTEETEELTDAQKRYNEQLQKWVENLAGVNVANDELLNRRLNNLKEQRELELLTDQEYFKAKQDAEQAFFDLEQTRLNEANAKKLGSEEARLAAQLELDKRRADSTKRIEHEITKQKEKEEKQREADTKSSLSYIATLQNSNSMELFRIGQAAAIANATINMYEGISKAWALGPILGPILAPLVAVAGAAQIAGIAAQQPKFEQGGIVPGNSFSGDQVQARVNSGEMILNRSQQTELFRLANGGGSFGEEIRELVQLTRALLSKDERVVVNIGGRSVVDTLRSELMAGRSFA
jgi:hypothetical protein